MIGRIDTRLFKGSDNFMVLTGDGSWRGNAAIQKADPLAANLGVVNSGLFIIAARLQDAISAATDPNNPEPADLRMLQPAVDHYLRVTRQIDRFIQLELRLSEPAHGRLKGE